MSQALQLNALPEKLTPLPFVGLEVATLASDTLRASIRVTGTLTSDSGALLTSVLRTHIKAGRRYLRVDLDTAQVVAIDVIDALVGAHNTITALGGMLVFENAGPRVVDAIRDATMFVQLAN